MKRIVDAYLKDWKTDPYRKPILINGARQIGKTHAVRQLGKIFENYVELNFEEEPHLQAIFAPNKSLDPRRVLEDIFSLTQKNITAGKTLLFFDEIQAVPHGIISLRYFYEKMPELHVIAAGSLVNFAIQQVGMPVGRIRILNMYPMSFIEFLATLGNGGIGPILEPKYSRSDDVHNHLLGLIGKYLAIGGMPEAVKQWNETGNIVSCLQIHQDVINAYRRDFNTYARTSQIDHVTKVFASIPRQLGGKFKFSIIEGDYRKRELAPALDLLVTAGVAHKITYTAAHGLPLGAEVDLAIYKTILMDGAISQKMLGLDAGSWIRNPLEMFINKGPLIEAFVGQELLACTDPFEDKQLYYWQRTERSSEAEVDYVIQDQEHIIPIEVKSGHGSTLKSMHMFLESHPKSPYGIRFSTQNYSVHEKIHSYPLYAIAQVMLKDKEMALKALS